MHNYQYQRVRDLREDADLTQKQVADKLFLHLTQYRRYECGESELPMNIAIQIATLYDVSLDYLSGLCNDKRGLNAADLTDEEIRLLRGFRALDPKSQGRILERLEMLQT